MYIRSVETQNYGPFSCTAKLTLEPTVTVLTGPNDVGKSALLRLLGRICRADLNTQVEAREFNQDNLFNSGPNWDEHEDFGAIVKLELSDPLPEDLNPQIRGHSGAAAKVSLSPKKGKRQIVKLYQNDKGVNTGEWPWPKSMRGIWLPPTEEIGDLIEFDTANPLELRLLRHAFGKDFQAVVLNNLPLNLYHLQLAKASENLNRLSKRILPQSLGITWKFTDQADRKAIGLLLTDRHGGVTSLGFRGTGLRKVMSAVAHLMDHDLSKPHTLVLFDEPENSLHADSQHLLRTLLESLGAMPTVQVVYATHSPSMINVMRPESIRLLSRSSEEGKATSRIDNMPFKGNYFPVRMSLGITPADSLLYAPVTIIVEGDTEVIGIPLLLLKLMNAKTPGFEDVDLLLSQSHLLDGMGDRFGFVCQMAKSQGAKPVIFLDGDKKRHLAQHKLHETHPDVPVITLADGKEFEQLVPPGVYISALAQVIEDTGRQVFEAGFRTWEQREKLPERIVFSKRIGRWLDSLELNEPRKAPLMRQAIELATPEQVELGPLRELVSAIRRLLAS
jgi:energy-coupling factor transporter ATP-binding protein EcfA2